MARYALVIGIAEYTGSFKGLETPVQNANAIADILDRYGDFNQVKRLPFRREAGQKDLGRVIRKPLLNETLVRELQQFLQDADGSDVLIYYSGHGFTKFDQLSQRSEGYLAPSDCQIELNSAGQVVSEKNGISLVGLDALLNRYAFNSLVVILDCCNAGAFLESGMVRRDVKTFNYQRDYYLITACRGSSKAYEGDEYSLLSAAVLKGLSPENAAPESSRISGDRLFDVIGNELQNTRQEPIRMGWGRLITLVRYPQKPESTEPTFQAFNPANPYMGLKPFEKEQAAYFFGREQSIRALLDRLTANRFLAVIGPSGCGKSSLVRAGLLPELESDRIPGSSEWQVEIITPGQYPLQALTSSLSQHQSDDKPIVLFVDQFEELFTLCPNEEEQRAFIKRLNEETTNPEKQTRVVIAMRGDFLDRCARFQESADLINSTAPTTYVVIPLTEAKLVAELEDSITCPAVLHGASFEPGLVSRIVDDVVNQLGAMPLLQYALAQLWDNCISSDGTSRLLTIQSYRAIAGVRGALQKWADQFYTSLSPDDQAFVRELISELVQIGDAGEVTRRRATWERLRAFATSQEQLDHIIGRLVYQRLLVADNKTVEVAHEALLSESRLIQGWIEENREDIRLQQRLEIYCREWEEHDCSEDYLLDTGRLAAIEEWVERKQPRLMTVEQKFIEKSQERRKQQLQTRVEQERKLREEAERRAIAEIDRALEAGARAEAEAARVKEAQARIKAERRRTQISVIGGTLVVVLMFLLGTLQVQSSKREAQASKALTVQVLSSLSKTYLDTGNQLEALIAGVKALKVIETNQLRAPLEIKEIIRRIHESNRLQEEVHVKEVLDASFSKDGQYIVSAGRDQMVRIWTNKGVLFKSFEAHDNNIWGVNFDRSENNLVSASADGTVKLWSIDGELIRTFRVSSTDENEQYLEAVISNDNSLVAAASWDGTVKIWNLKDGRLINILRGHDDAVYDVEFSPDGETIASASWDRTIRIWRVEDGKLIHLLKGHDDSVVGVSFSADGELLASASWDDSVKVWRVENGQLLRTFLGHTDDVFDIDISPNKETVASASKDKTIRIWNLTNGALLETFNGHKDDVNSVEFSPDGGTLISGGDDQTVRLWRIDSIDTTSLDIEELLHHSCEWLFNFLKNNPGISPEDAIVCNNI